MSSLTKLVSLQFPQTHLVLTYLCTLALPGYNLIYLCQFQFIPRGPAWRPPWQPKLPEFLLWKHLFLIALISLPVLLSFFHVCFSCLPIQFISSCRAGWIPLRLKKNFLCIKERRHIKKFYIKFYIKNFSWLFVFPFSPSSPNILLEVLEGRTLGRFYTLIFKTEKLIEYIFR